MLQDVKFHIERERACNVLVIGGGPAGVCAAIASAPMGGKTILVEEGGFCGGMATRGLVGPFMTCYDAEGHSKMAKPYDIPYGALVPKGVENLLTAGRCISGTHRAHASYRVMAICMATGKAAGLAAALSIKENVMPRKLAPKTVQAGLLKKGVVFQ